MCVVFVTLLINPSYGQSDIERQINETHFLYKNGTVVSLTPEEIQKVKQYVQSFIEAMRRSGADFPPPNATERTYINETIVKQVLNFTGETAKNQTNALGVPLQYSNYTSDKYKIQFQYPSNWLIEEKTNRFEEGSDVMISNNNVASGRIGISFFDDLLEAFGTTNLQSATNDLHKDLLNSFTYDYRTIESPTFLNIDGQKFGTFLLTAKQKYETDPFRGAQQFWITMVGNNGYMINFISTPEAFDSPENTEIRDHLIKSIKFLGTNNQTSTNTTNRFDTSNNSAFEGTSNNSTFEDYQNKNCPPMSLVLCTPPDGGPRCPNGYHRSPDGDCEPARDVPTELGR